MTPPTLHLHLPDLSCQQRQHSRYLSFKRFPLTLAITHSVIGREEPIPPERGASGTTRPNARRILASSASAS